MNIGWFVLELYKIKQATFLDAKFYLPEHAVSVTVYVAKASRCPT